MTIDQYARVRFATDRFVSKGVSKGDYGYVIEVYRNGDYEVEVSDKNGITIAQVVATEADIEEAEPRAGEKEDAAH